MKIKRVSKPYRGLIDAWRPYEWPGITRERIDAMYGKTVTNYVIVGRLVSEPELRLGPGPIRTSLVVKPFDPSELKEGMMVETLNSRYKLGVKE